MTSKDKIVKHKWYDLKGEVDTDINIMWIEGGWLINYILYQGGGLTFIPDKNHIKFKEEDLE